MKICPTCKKKIDSVDNAYGPRVDNKVIRNVPVTYAPCNHHKKQVKTQEYWEKDWRKE